MIKKRVLFSVGFGLLLLVTMLSSPCLGTGNFINYQGKLTDVDGQPANGQVAIDFSLWNDPSDTDPATGRIWQESQQVTVTDGIFNVRLGSVSSFNGVDFSDKNIYLQMEVEGTALEPRTPLATIPAAYWSYHAADSEKLGGFSPLVFAKKSDLSTGSSGVAVDWSNHTLLSVHQDVCSVGSDNQLDGACNDDAISDDGAICSGLDSGLIRDSAVTLQVSQGDVYLIRVSKYTGAANAFRLSLRYNFIDSDNDGVADENDLCPGFDDTADEDHDGIPDNCDTCWLVDNNGAPDCNENGVPDSCDLAWNGRYEDFSPVNATVFTLNNDAAVVAAAGACRLTEAAGSETGSVFV